MKDAMSIFGQAQEIAGTALRAAFLDEACGGDEALRAEVEGLLAAADEAGDFLAGPAVDIARTAAMPSLADGPGDVIGAYQLMEQIGEGGFGIVFVAEQQRPVRRKVALKIIKPGMDTREVIARFEAERQALALMDHPNIAKVFDAGTTASGRPYFVMELVRGLPITEYCDQSCLTPPERLKLVVAVCYAIQHAHQKGIIHRDVKPTNVLVTLHDGRPAVKVIDFGVAKALSQQLTERTVYTKFAQMIGTPLYMSPEQAEMSGLDIDTRSDIYSLGVLLYELLTGTTPFDRERFMKAAALEIRRIIAEEEPPKPSTRLTQSGERLPSIAALRGTEPARLTKVLRGDLDWIVMKCLEKDRTRRYETANGLAHDIERYLNDEPVEATPPSAWYGLKKIVRRHRRTFAAMFAVAAALMIGTVVSVYFAVQSSRRAGEAQRNLATSRQEKRRADASARQATLQREEANDSLCRSLYNEARAILASDQAGRRWQALDRLKHAEALRRRNRLDVASSPADQRLPTKGDLRSAGVAALLTNDARLVRETMISDFSNFVAGLTSGRAGHIALSQDGSIAVAEFHESSQRHAGNDVSQPATSSLDRSLRALRLVDARTGRALLSPTGDSYGHLPGCFALNSGGKLLAVGEATRAGVRVKIWNVPDFGRPAQEFTWSQDAPAEGGTPWHQLVFSSDGRHLAYVRTGYSRIDAVVWDLQTQEERTFHDEKDRGGSWGSSLFTPDSRWLVLRAGRSKMAMWDAKDDNPRRHFNLPAVFGDGLEFHPHNPWVVGNGGVAWNYQDNREVGKVASGRDGEIGAVAFNSQGTHLAVGGQTGIAVYQLPSLSQVLRLQQPSGVMALRWTPDNRHLVVAQAAGALQTWEVDLTDLHSVTALDGGPVRDFAISPDGRWIGTSNDTGARLIHRSTGITEREFPHAVNLVFGPKSERLAVVPSRRAPAEPEPDLAEETPEPVVVVADIRTGKELWRQNVRGRIVSAVFNRQGDLLAGIQTADGNAELWNLSINHLVGEMSDANRAFSLDFPILSPDGSLAAVVSDASRSSGPGNVIVLDTDSLAQVAQIKSPDDLMHVQFSSDNRFIAGIGAHVPYFKNEQPPTVTGLTATTYIWSLPDAAQVLTDGPHPPFRATADLTFNPDSSLFALARRDGLIELWNLEDREQLFHFHAADSLIGPRFTPDGISIVWCSQNHTGAEPRAQLEYVDLSLLRRRLADIGLDW